MLKDKILPLLLLFPALTLAGPNIGIFTGKTILKRSENQQLWVNGSNQGPTKTVDVHIGLISPSGVVYEYPNWNTSLNPWLKSIQLNKNFNFPAQLITTVSNLPSEEPGIWQAAAAITEPGTLDILSFATKSFAGNFEIDETNNSPDPRLGFVTLQNLNQSSSNFDLLIPFGVFWLAEDAANFANSLSINFANSAFNNAPIESCIFEKPLLNNLNNKDFQVETLDAGDLKLTSSALGLYHLLKTTSLFTFYRDIFKDDFLKQASLRIEPGTEYTLDSEGGNDIGAFSVSLTAPETVSFTKPTEKGIISQNVNADLTLKWPKGNPQEIILVSIIHSNTSSSERAAISCQFVDDGSAIIPSTQLAKMKNFMADSTATSTLTISRNTSELIKPKGNHLDFGVFSVGNANARELRLH